MVVDGELGRSPAHHCTPRVRMTSAHAARPGLAMEQAGTGVIRCTRGRGWGSVAKCASRRVSPLSSVSHTGATTRTARAWSAPAE